MPSSSVSTATPVHVVPSLDHFVTQWMSTVNVSCGSALSSSQVHDFEASTAPWTESDHVSSDVRGVGPAERTGKSSTTYWPGGTRAGSTSGRRGRPWNPREKDAMAAIVRPLVRRVTSRSERSARPGGASARGGHVGLDEAV